jgi:hypothetical protein
VNPLHQQYTPLLNNTEQFELGEVDIGLDEAVN